MGTGVIRQLLAGRRTKLGGFGLQIIGHLLAAGGRGGENYVLTRWLFLRLLGVIYFCAFASYSRQVLGLVGRNGILPAGELLQALREPLGRERYLRVPTLAWLNTSDAFLLFLCRSGMLLALLQIFGIAQAPLLLLLWLWYLSLVSVSREFLGYQWDVLLLETGFLAIFFAPARVLPSLRREAPPSLLVLWLLRLLLFRLMFFSGLVKITSGDPTWRSLAALRYHYETQPLPTPVAWYMHQLPPWFHVVSAALVFLIELLVPFLICGPRPARLAAAGLLAWLQLLIMATGNYAFFNWLALALCSLLVDDRLLRQLLPGSIRRSLPQVERRAPLYRLLFTAPVAAVILPLNVALFADMLNTRQRVPRRMRTTMIRLEPLHLVNRYGLFAVMTTARPEIVVEGSADGREWVAYEFRHKPGDINRRPTWVAPHQPRLDWQMWFAALSGLGGARWFSNFMRRLLDGEPDVMALLPANPFPERPPRFVRAWQFDYRFTHGGSGEAWWRRELDGLYFPPVALSATRP
jgi:hypothetical protein